MTSLHQPRSETCEVPQSYKGDMNMRFMETKTGYVNIGSE